MYKMRDRFIPVLEATNRERILQMSMRQYKGLQQGQVTKLEMNISWIIMAEYLNASISAVSSIFLDIWPFG